MLRWDIRGDLFFAADCQCAMSFLDAQHESLDTARLAPVSIYLLPEDHAMYGWCYYPTRRDAQYRISCYLSPRYPQVVVRDITRGGFDGGYIVLHNHGEALVWLATHEIGHFARHSRQCAGRNTESNADRDAYCALQEYLVYCDHEVSHGQ